MGSIFNLILVHPLLNLLVYVYQYIPDIGIAIILITVLVRLILYPSFHKSLKHQRAVQALAPKMQEIKDKYKEDQQRQASAMMELYKVHKVNPLSSCLPILIQLPILFALYQVFIQSLAGQELNGLYSFVPQPDHINTMFLGIVDLALKQNYFLAVLAAVLQFLQTRSFQKTTAQNSASADPQSKFLANYLLYFLPVMTFFFCVSFPAGMSLYWITTTVFGIAQQYLILRHEAKEVLYGNK